MGVLKKPYEISIWEDVLTDVEELIDNETVTVQKFVEKKILIIGSNEMISLSRAMSPKLVTNINGTNTLTFDIYYRYKDNITGETVDNPFAPFITNERKIKLKYGDEWYDLLIKSVKIDTTKYTYSVTASDLYIIELSRNGFNFTFDEKLLNNVGSAQVLAERCLKDTDWVVPLLTNTINDVTEFIPDLSKEALVRLTYIGGEGIVGKTLYHIDESGKLPSESIVEWDSLNNAIIYGFYSCCKDKSSRFSFLVIPITEEITKDDERTITNKNVQYFVDLNDADYGAEQINYGIYIPNFFNFGFIDEEHDGANAEFISSKYRGARYNYTPDTEYNPLLEQYVTTYTKDNKNYYGFTETEYDVPELINNIVTNPNTFKSTSGWHIGFKKTETEDDSTLVNEAIRLENNAFTTILNDLKTNISIQDKEYTPVLHFKGDNKAVVYNTGFFDNRNSIKNFTNGQLFVVKLKIKYIGAEPDFDIAIGSYSINGRKVDISNGELYCDEFSRSNMSLNDGYLYKIITIKNADKYTPNIFKRLTGTNKIYIVLYNFSREFYIENFEIFPYIATTDGRPFVDPSDLSIDAKFSTYYVLYDADNVQLINENGETKNDISPIYRNLENPKKEGYSISLSCEKRRAVAAKESNYFNIIQTICENFECWAKFNLTHDLDGKITNKQITFHNYIGQENFAGFRYGVNLKSIQRTDDSKLIVTKLIVKQNSNLFGKSGFCTITRAPSNVTGENYIYNLDYYITLGLLAPEDWIDFTYGTGSTIGYFPNLSVKNKLILKCIDTLLLLSVVLMLAESDLTIYENGCTAADDGFTNAAQDFKDFFGCEWDNVDWEDLELKSKIEDNEKYLIKCVEFFQAKQDYEKKRDAQEKKINGYTEEDIEEGTEVRVKGLKEKYADTNAEYQGLIEEKEDLNKDFYSKFYRFLQEGTWNSEDYYDDEMYYLDALSTLYNSSVPKVTYSFSVLELSQLEGYEDYTFKLGDRTFVEDVEYFGYDTDGNPVREDVVLTEITYNLDTPDKNSIKVLNYKNLFQDLFKRITATVQSVLYSTGAYDKAALLADANDKEKVSFLQNALNDSSLILQNLADLTVRLDSQGLTIIDGLEVNKRLRAVSGGILLSEDGGNTWLTGITANGINANKITTGTLDTGKINIMFGEYPCFRWDLYGITAYEYKLVQEGGIERPTYIDLNAGVRFDRFGIYGFKVPWEGANWHPTLIVNWDNLSDPLSIRTYSTFELTKEGLHLSLVGFKYNGIEHTGIALLGKIENKIYNSWNGSTPVETTTTSSSNFVKVLHIANKQGTNYIDMYDDGTIVANSVKLTGNITATSGTFTGRIEATEGYIGDNSSSGFTISNNSIQKGKTSLNDGTSGVYIGADGISLGSYNNGTSSAPSYIPAFKVESSSNSAIIYATSGKIGGFDISSNAIKNKKTAYNETSNDGVYIGTAGIGLGKGKFYVTLAGKLHAEGAEITGKITSTEGYLGGWKINSKWLGVVPEEGGSPANVTSFLSLNNLRAWSFYNGNYIDNIRFYITGSFIVTNRESSSSFGTTAYSDVIVNGTINATSISISDLYTSTLTINGNSVGTQEITYLPLTYAGDQKPLQGGAYYIKAEVGTGTGVKWYRVGDSTSVTVLKI